METVLLVVVLVFAILQIILFFKVWGMTNDVDKIRKKYLVEADYYDLVKEYYKGNPELASLLFENIYREYEKLYLHKSEYDDYKDVRSHYMPIYKKAGIKFPAVLNSINSQEDFVEVFLNIELQ